MDVLMFEEEKSSRSDDWGEVLRAIRKMHPFVIAFTFALNLFRRNLQKPIVPSHQVNDFGSCAIALVLCGSF
jgi:hypothetical protein